MKPYFLVTVSSNGVESSYHANRFYTEGCFLVILNIQNQADMFDLRKVRFTFDTQHLHITSIKDKKNECSG